MLINNKAIGILFLPIIILFSGCVDLLGGCPPVYGASVSRVPLPMEFEVYSNISRSDLASVPIILILMDEVIENSSLTYKSAKLDPDEWNQTVKFLVSLDLAQEEWQYQYQWIVFYENEFLDIELYIMVC